MITLNKNEQDSLNRMIETSTVMGQTLTQEEMDYYNANYNGSTSRYGNCIINSFNFSKKT